MNSRQLLNRPATLFRRHLAGWVSGLLLCGAAQAQVGLATLTVGDLPVTLACPQSPL